MEAYPIIDADAHVVEAVPGIRKYLSAEYQVRPIWTTHSWDMDFGGTMGNPMINPRSSLPTWTRRASARRLFFLLAGSL